MTDFRLCAVFYMAAVCIKGIMSTGSCPAQPEVMCGAPEIVNAGSTGAITFKPVPFLQNYKDCDKEEVQQYRTADGTCNHVFNLGSANTPLRRMLPPVYDDTINAPRTRGVNGFPLPSPTDVSRVIHVDRDAFNGRTVMYMQWGQFIDHDITLSPIPTETNKTLRCCGPNGEVLQYMADKNCMPIILSSADNRFRGSCMEFTRSLAALSAPGGHEIIPRAQLNAITSFIDGSMIYGNSEELQKELREKTANGPGTLMKTSFNDLLPRSPEDNCIHRPEHFCFLAGDVRVNEQPGLTVTHTVWVRLHNIIARELIRGRPSDSQEELFQLTRKIVVAILQNIHYKEWLPLVLGSKAMTSYNLLPGKRVAYSGSVDPRISSAFSAAAYRFGHSLIPRHYNISGQLFPLRKLFNRPDVVFDDFNGVLMSLISSNRVSQAQKTDRYVVDEVTGHLFEPPDQQKRAPSRGLDLAALNIQRGRDHGLPPFNRYRKLCGLTPFASFDEFGTNIGKRLASLYRSVEDIDLFTGGLLEEPVEDGRVGPTFACIIAQQFQALKFGDRFYFETERMPEGFTDAQLTAIRRMTLAHVCCQLKGVTSLQRRLFEVPDRGNPQVRCRALRRQFQRLIDLWANQDSSWAYVTSDLGLQPTYADYGIPADFYDYAN